jgi:hypothetical protein
MLSNSSALRRCERDGFLLCQNSPLKLQFSIDLSPSWTCGKKFKGIKMIPNEGIRFVTYAVRFFFLTACDLQISINVWYMRL